MIPSYTGDEYNIFLKKLLWIFVEVLNKDALNTINSPMKKLFSTILLPIFLSFSAYSQFLRIDPDHAMGGTVSQIFDSVKYIPLETTKESIFGEITRLEVVDSFFLISDFLSTRSLLIFDKSGRFHGKITNMPSNNFAVDRKNKEIYVYSNGKFYIYNIQGELLKSLPFIHDGDMQKYTCIGKGDILYISTIQKEGKMICLLNFYNLFSKLHKYSTLITIPLGDPQLYSYAEVAMFGIYSSFFNWSNNQIYFSLKYDYSLYKTDSVGTILKAYSFLFPLIYSLPENYILDTIFTKEKKQYLLNKKNIVTEIPDFFSVNKNFIFSIVGSGGYKKSFFLYPLESGKLLSFDHISPDSLSFFLPIGNNILAEDKNNCYSTMPSYEMFTRFGKDSKINNYPPVLQKYFSTQSRKSNPVIVQLKPKEKL